MIFTLRIFPFAIPISSNLGKVVLLSAVALFVALGYFLQDVRQSFLVPMGDDLIEKSIISRWIWMSPVSKPPSSVFTMEFHACVAV